MLNTRNDTATATVEPITCTQPNLQMLILNSPGTPCSIRAKRSDLGC